MSHELPPMPPAADATPPRVDEMPPYGESHGWRTTAVVGVVLALAVVAAVAVALVVRAVWRAVRRRPTPERVVMFAAPDSPYSGPVYRVEFYDGAYRQLTDVDLSVVLLDGIPVSAQLGVLAERLASRVRQRDSQQCFDPRVVLVDGAGRTVHEWSGVA